MNARKFPGQPKMHLANGGKMYKFQLDDASQAALQDSLRLLQREWSGSCFARAAFRAMRNRLVAGEIEQVKRELEQAR